MTELSLNLEAYCHELFIYPFLDNVLYKKTNRRQLYQHRVRKNSPVTST
jgi:hypothetical protein